MGTFKTQMLWEAIRKGDLTGAIGLLESGNINLEERDGVSSRQRYHTIPNNLSIPKIVMRNRFTLHHLCLMVTPTV